MKSLAIVSFLTLLTFGHGLVIGYLRIPEEDLEPDFEPVDTEPPELVEPNVMQGLYYTKLIPLLLNPITAEKNRFKSFGGFANFGLRFWKTSV